MTHNNPQKPAPTERAETEKQARLAREAAALRANLRKRKQQVQARQDPPAEEKP
jgi:hypothetical protein